MTNDIFLNISSYFLNFISEKNLSEKISIFLKIIYLVLNWPKYSSIMPMVIYGHGMDKGNCCPW
jgi:hypothetical protein